MTRIVFLIAIMISAAAQAQESCGSDAIGYYGSFPMQSDLAGHMGIALTIGGKPRLMTVDTGGATSTISSSLVSELGLSTRTAVYDRQVDFQGNITREFVVLPTLTLGTALFNNSRFAALADNDPLLANGKVVGSIGPDKLRMLDVDMDFGHGVIRFYGRDHCQGHIAYWTSLFAFAPFSVDESGHILLSMTLDGKPVRVGLDTGSPVSIMTIPTASRLFGLDSSSPGVEPVGSLAGSNDPSQRTYSYKFKSLLIDGLEVKNPEVVLTPDNVSSYSRKGGGLPDMILGLRELSTLHLYIAYGDQILYLTGRNAPYSEKDEPVQKVNTMVEHIQFNGLQ